MTSISVIVGSTGQGRFSEKPAQWTLQHLRKRDGIEARLFDLRDFPMPFFDQSVTPDMPGRAPYENEVVKRWTAAIAASDGFVFVTPEYNYGPSAVLKNAIDWVYPEWNRKAAAFVSYGSAMGARGIQQLRETMIEVQIAPVRSSIHIPASQPLPTLPRAASAMKIRTERRDCCAPAVSNGCEPAAESGMEVAPANRDGCAASSFGSPCRPSWSWGHPRASTWRQRPFPKTGQRVSSSVPTEPRQVRSKLLHR